jgi:hypothetical protein
MRRKLLVGVAIGAVACLAYGSTRAFGTGLPPYSAVYAVSFGLIVGIVTYSVLSIRSPLGPWLFAVLLFVGLAGSLAITSANNHVSSVRAPAPAAAQPPTTSFLVINKTAALTGALRNVAASHGPVNYTNALNAYSELSAELDVDTDHTPRAEAIRALLPSVKDALDTAKTTVDNDALIRLAVQLDHAA